MAQERGRTDACILSGGPDRATYRRPFRWCCCPRRLVRPRLSGKDEAGRIHLAFSGGRQGYSWSWIKGRTPDEIDLPRRFYAVARLTMRGSTPSTPTNIQPHAYVCVGFRDHIVQRMEFDDHEDHQKNWNDTDDCAC